MANPLKFVGRVLGAAKTDLGKDVRSGFSTLVRVLQTKGSGKRLLGLARQKGIGIPAPLRRLGISKEKQPLRGLGKGLDKLLELAQKGPGLN